MTRRRRRYDAIPFPLDADTTARLLMALHRADGRRRIPVIDTAEHFFHADRSADPGLPVDVAVALQAGGAYRP